MGGLQWAGLPVVAAYLGVVDVEALIHRLAIIKLHRPPEDGAANAPGAPGGLTLTE